MHWELLDVESVGLIGRREAEVEVLALVRELVGKDWPAEALPAAVTRAELMRRAEGASQGRRTA